MRVPTQSETDLLVPLHEGMFEQPMWSTFLARLRAATGARYAMLLFRPPGTGQTVQLAAGGAAPPRLRELFDRDFGGDDPLQTRGMREGRVYTLEELVELGGGSARAFRDTLLLPFGLSHMRSVRLREDSGLDGWLLVAGEAPMQVAVARLLSSLIPHLRVALRVLATLERERARATVTAGAFGHIDFGWIAIDARCRIVDSDPQAEAFMRRTGALRRGPYDRLTPSSPEVDRQLTALAKEFAADPEARPRAINLAQDPWIDVLVSPVRVEALSGGGKAVAVVYFRGEQSSSADRCQQLVDVFDLTQAEARFAWSIAQGLSIADAAEEHGLTIETARNYSKKVYAKTGARGQVDLMRRVLTSVVALTVH